MVQKNERRSREATLGSLKNPLKHGWAFQCRKFLAVTDGRGLLVEL